MLQVPALYSLGDVLKMNQDLFLTLIWENFGSLTDFLKQLSEVVKSYTFIKWQVCVISLRGHLRRISGFKAVCSVFRYSVSGLNCLE